MVCGWEDIWMDVLVGEFLFVWMYGFTVGCVRSYVVVGWMYGWMFRLVGGCMV